MPRSRWRTDRLARPRMRRRCSVQRGDHLGWVGRGSRGDCLDTLHDRWLDRPDARPRPRWLVDGHDPHCQADRDPEGDRDSHQHAAREVHDLVRLDGQEANEHDAPDRREQCHGDRRRCEEPYRCAIASDGRGDGRLGGGDVFRVLHATPADGRKDAATNRGCDAKPELSITRAPNGKSRLETARPRGLTSPDSFHPARSSTTTASALAARAGTSPLPAVAPRSRAAGDRRNRWTSSRPRSYRSAPRR